MPETVKVIHYPAPEKPLTKEEIALALAQLGQRDDLWRALMQMLQVRLAAAISASISLDPLAPGRLAEVTELQEQLANYRANGWEIKRKSGE